MNYLWSVVLLLVLALPVSAEPLKEASNKTFLNEPWIVYGALGLAGILLLAIVGCLLFFLVYQPRTKRKPLLAAIEIVEKGRVEQYNEAEGYLDLAIVSGLKKADVTEAYFLMAFVKSALEKYEEAAAYILKADRQSQETVYLILWLHVRLKEYKKAYDIFVEESKLLTGYLDSAKLASIACMHLGMEHWANREVDAAISYFDLVRQLKIHSDLIPESISNHQVTLGLVALFDKHIDEAKQFFENARIQAVKDKVSALEAELGLLLCRWINQDYPAIDDELLKLDLGVLSIDDKTGEICKDAMSEKKMLLRNILFWQAISLIFTWLHKERHAGLEADELGEFEKRLARVVAVDTEFGDPFFVKGLILYYFAGEARKGEAMEQLRKSAINVPEVDIILNKEAKNIELREKSLDNFFALAKSYLSDRSVPFELRRQLRDKMEMFSKFKTLSKEITVEQGTERDSPSMTEIQQRGQIIHRKITSIIRPKLAAENVDSGEVLDSLLGQMNETLSAISQQAKKLENTSQQLMINTSEFLFAEEESVTSEKISG